MKRDATSLQSAPQPISPSANQLAGRHARLERELALAFSTQPWPAALIDRLANELAATERELANPGSVDRPDA